MKIWIDVEDSAGVKLGDGPITSAIYWENTDRLDRAGAFRFSMPASDPRAALIQPKRVVRCWGMVGSTPTEQGSGIIDKVTIRLEGNVVMLEIEGDNLARELVNRSVGFLGVFTINVGVYNGPERIMAYAPAGWSLDLVNGYATTTHPVYAKFAGESVLAALSKVAEKIGDHFRIAPDRKVVWLKNDIVSSGVRAIKSGDPIALEGNDDVALITELEESEDTYDLITRIYPFGSGNGDARLTLASTDESAPAGFTLDLTNNYLKKDAAEITYGQIERFLSFKDIAPISNSDWDMQQASNYLLRAALTYLERFSQPQTLYRIAVAKLNKAVLPGQTIRVVYRRVIDGYKAVDIDQDLHVLESTTRIDQTGIRTVEMQVSTVDRWPVSDDEILVSEIEEGRVFEAHPQMNANAYVVSYREPMDNSKAAKIDFWLGPEVVTVAQVVMRFRIDPLRSTVKSAAAGGGSTVTSAAGGGQTATGGSHLHNTTVPSGSGNTTIEWYQDSGFVIPVSPSGARTLQVGVNSSHDHTIDDHSHSVTVPEHTHAVQYGIFEESSGNTLAESDLIYKVNGSVDLAASVVDIGGGWFELDVTDYIINPNTYRPAQKTNQLVISTDVAKTAQITGQLVVRTVIQATALL
jgi:hypothetical protein